jgi:hypothetical protein
MKVRYTIKLNTKKGTTTSGYGYYVNDTLITPEAKQDVNTEGQPCLKKWLQILDLKGRLHKRPDGVLIGATEECFVDETGNEVYYTKFVEIAPIED